jgi:hypothetical protein
MNLKEWSMKRTSLIRLGGLAAMVGGVLYVSQTYLLWPLLRTLARLSRVASVRATLAGAVRN